MLRDEHRMISPRRLTSIVARLRGRETLRNQIRRLLHDMPDSPRVEVRELFPLEKKLAAKSRLGEAFERSVDVDWHSSWWIAVMRRFIVACFLAWASLVSAQDLVPLNDLGPAPYRLGYYGGLYDNGTNVMPREHLAAGMTFAGRVKPIDGKIGILVVGMGDTARVVCAPYRSFECESGSFTGLVRASKRVNPAVVVVNGAFEDYQSVIVSGNGQALFDSMSQWILRPAGINDEQVQVAWLQISSDHPNLSIIRQAGDAYYVKGATGNILRALKKRYPNLQIAYLSSRAYGGYSSNAWNTEPFAYETGLSVRWVVLEQIAQVQYSGPSTDSRTGPVSYIRGDVPWIAWGPYFWANGMNARSDGLRWEPDDFEATGEFLSERGAHKAALMLFDFFSTEPTARKWFLAPGTPARFRTAR